MRPLSWLTAAALGQDYADKHYCAPKSLPRAERLIEYDPGEYGRGYRLQEQAYRGEGGRQVGEGVGDQALSPTWETRATPKSIAQPYALEAIKLSPETKATSKSVAQLTPPP